MSRASDDHASPSRPDDVRVARWTDFKNGRVTTTYRVYSAATAELVVPGTCGAKSATTPWPCRWRVTRDEPCPHHGPDNDSNRCNVPTSSGAPCRWNIATRGPCRTHPESIEHFNEVQRERQAVKRLQSARDADLRQRAHEARQRFVMATPCPRCGADEGIYCRTPNGSPALKLHNHRSALAAHTRHAASGDCPSCGAQAGQLCTTASGTTAAKAHALRVQQAATEIAVGDLTRVPLHMNDPEVESLQSLPPGTRGRPRRLSKRHRLPMQGRRP